MAKIDLATARLHVRADSDDEDMLIEAWIGAAYLIVEGSIFRKVYDEGETIPEEDTAGIVTNEAINASALLILGHLYANREAVTQGQKVEVPMGAMWLLTPYINTDGGY